MMTTNTKAIQCTKIRKQLGIKRGWEVDERHSVRYYHAKYWGRWKARMFDQYNIFSVGDIPGMKTSLQSLYDQGYSVSDISAMFGVSRERARQWFKKFKIKKDPNRHGSLVRVWSDELNHFTAISPSEFNELLIKAREKDRSIKRLNRTHKYALQMDRDIDNLRRMVKENGFVPYKAEFLEYLRCKTPAEIALINTLLGVRWGAKSDSEQARVPRRYYDGTPRTLSYTEAWDDLYVTAGFTRPDGRSSKRRRI